MRFDGTSTRAPVLGLRALWARGAGVGNCRSRGARPSRPWRSASAMLPNRLSTMISAHFFVRPAASATCTTSAALVRVPLVTDRLLIRRVPAPTGRTERLHAAQESATRHTAWTVREERRDPAGLGRIGSGRQPAGAWLSSTSHATTALGRPPRRWSAILVDGDRGRRMPGRTTGWPLRSRRPLCSEAEFQPRSAEEGATTVTADATPDRESRSSDEIFGC